MDGLECSELLFSKVKGEDYRFDSEYYSKKNLFLQKTIDLIGNKSISEYGGKLDCSAFYPAITGFYSRDRKLVPFIRVNEIVRGLVSITDETVFLPMNVLEENHSTIALAYPGDIIIAKGGNTLAKVGLVTDEYPVYATCRDVIILRTSDLQSINQYYLWSFLHSEYGQGLLWRSASQTGQPHLTLPAIRKMKIPEYSKLQNLIKTLYLHSTDLKRSSVHAYCEAERLLSSVMMIPDDEQESVEFSVRSLSESFLRTGRIDAEYYQSKYDKIASCLSSDNTVRSSCTVYDSNYTPQKSSSYKYIELANVDHFGNIAGVDVYLGNELPSRARRVVSAGQVVVSSVEGSLQSCALITDDYDVALCSTGFFVLDSEIFNSETLLVLFKSAPVQSLMKQKCSGTILPAITKEEFLSVQLPAIDTTTQSRIAAKIQDALTLYKHSKQLLEFAKRAVEMAIEQGEDCAVEWLTSKMREQNNG